MKISFSQIAAGVLALVVTATGGAAWTASSENAVQNNRIQTLEMRAEKTEVLIQKLDATAGRIDVLNERLERLLEAQRASEQRSPR